LSGQRGYREPIRRKSAEQDKVRLAVDALENRESVGVTVRRVAS
jgi:hypothetical protein